MNFTPLGEIDLVYLPGAVLVDYGSGGQYYGAMEGSWHGDRISGRLRVTNVAQKRADNINTPSLRGVLEAEDGTTMFVEMNGLSQIQGGGRVFVTSLTLRTGHPNYQWVNTLFAALEGELHRDTDTNEVRAHCRVYACEATIHRTSPGRDQSIRPTAHALSLPPSNRESLLVTTTDLRAESEGYHQLLEQSGIAREVVSLQPGEYVDWLLVYREVDDSARVSSQPEDTLESFLVERLSSVDGFDPVAAKESRVELLVRQRPVRPANLYAAALPLLPGSVARLHEWTLELNEIHAAEMEECQRRLGHAQTLFVQHASGADLLILVTEGDEPHAAAARLAISQHPFDQWFVHQMTKLTGFDFSAGPRPRNEQLWAWDKTMPGSAGERVSEARIAADNRKEEQQ